jgi:hypothetical protein
MATVKREFVETVAELIRQRDQARIDLMHAQETIQVLETELLLVQYRGNDALEKVAGKQSMTRINIQPYATSVPTSNMICGIWAPDMEHADLLGEAEQAWEALAFEGNRWNPQEALNILSAVMTRDLNNIDKIRCMLFLSAVMLASENTENACAHANEALHMCGYDPRTKDLAGTAHYLRGRVFLKIGKFRQAYWDFSLALFTHLYHEEAQRLQHLCESEIRRQGLEAAHTESGQSESKSPSVK